MLVARGLLAASVIGAAVLIAAVGGALVAGMVSVFPAIFLTTMVALWLSHGEAVPTAAVGPMMLGSASVASFALLSALAIPALGPAAGAAAAWVTAVGVVTVPGWLWLGRVGGVASTAEPQRSPAGDV